MSNVVKHAFQSGVSDGGESSLVRPSSWNAEHAFAGGLLGSLLYRDTGQSDGASWLAAGAAGAYLRGAGTSTAPLWSTLILPNAATAYRLPVATGTNTIGELAASGATGEYLAGVTGAVPAWATLNQAAVAGLTAASSPTLVALTLTNGQITFPATAVPSADANTLDDYEEGTFTAELRGSTAPATTPATTTGYYTKIGNKVTCIIYFANVDTTGATGTIQVTGLPFTSMNQAGHRSTNSVASYGLSVPQLYNNATVEVNTAIITFQSMSNDGAWLAPTITAGATKYMLATVVYFV